MFELLHIRYANKIFWLVCVILGVLLAGFRIGGFFLSDKVLMTFIASTTLNVLGIFVIVAKWLFLHNNHQKRANNIKQ
jgi:hypothetical protein